MLTIRSHQNFKTRLNYMLFDRFDASEREMRKYHFGTQMGFLGGMLSYLLDSVISNVSVMGYFGLTGIIYAIILLIIFFFVEKVKYLILVKELGLLVIVFYFTYQTGGILTCGGIILVGMIPVLVSLSFKNFRWIIMVFATYFISVIYLAIADKHLPGKDLIPPNWNLIFYASTLLLGSLVFFIFALLAQRIYTNLEHREAERQKEINDAKTRLYTNITHEFRTPLTVILGLAETLKGEFRDEIDLKAETIIRNGKNLLQLVDQMLDLSKMESGKLKVNKIKGDIVPFLRYIFKLQEYYAIEKNLRFTFHAENQSCVLDFDPEKVTTVVSNLLSNAIKFTPAGGKVNLNVAVSDHTLLMEVADNGVGIPKDKQDKIFDRFYQVDDKDTRKAGGTGIGLALTKELVELMGGELFFQSEPEKETVFRVKLPAEHVKLNDIGEIEDTIDRVIHPGNSEIEKIFFDVSKSDEQKHRLLIVEDNKDVLNYLTACYKSTFTIDVAYDGNEGLNKAVETIPDVIVSDVMMPEMDGFTLCKKVKDDYRTSHIPVILLTAKADITSRIQGLEQGADAYVVKPFNHKELQVRINKLIELRRKLHERYVDGFIGGKSDDPYFRREDQFMKKITNLIQKNLHDEFYDVQALCEDMAMSKSQLYRKFNALTDLPVARYIRRLRLRKAKHLLLNSSMNITEVSYEVGLKSLSTFSKLFKEEYGCNPTDFVRQNKAVSTTK